VRSSVRQDSVAKSVAIVAQFVGGNDSKKAVNPNHSRIIATNPLLHIWWRRCRCCCCCCCFAL